MRQQKHEKKTLDKRKNTKHSEGGGKKENHLRGEKRSQGRAREEEGEYKIIQQIKKRQQETLNKDQNLTFQFMTP